MENAHVLTISGRQIPAEIEERYNKWYDAAYGPIFMKIPGSLGIDRYTIIRPNYILPNELNLYHNENWESWKNRSVNSDRINVIRDSSITFNRIQRFWHNTFELMRSFKNEPSLHEPIANTVVENSPIIHIEGYKIPETESGKFEGWFNKWATQIYIPLLLKIPGVKACNFFKLLDFNDPIYDAVRFVEIDMPRFVSITYLDSPDSLDNFNQSAEFGAFRGSLELGFSESVKIMWGTEYQLFKSYRPQQ